MSDPRSLGSWRIKGTDESTLVTDSSVPLMRHDPSDLGSLNLIQIISKERSLKNAVEAGRNASLLQKCPIESYKSAPTTFQK